MANDSELLMRVTVKVDPATVRQLEQVASATTKMQTSAQASTGGLKNMQRGIQNTSYQLQDFIVQVTGGQDAMRALGQQLPQALIGFGAAGAAIGVVASLIPVAVDAFKSLTKEADDLEESTKKAEAALGALKKSLDFETKKSMDPLIESFKEGNTATRDWIIATETLKVSLGQLAVIDLEKSLVNSIKEGVSQIGYLQEVWIRVKNSFNSPEGLNGANDTFMSRRTPQFSRMTDKQILSKALGVDESVLTNFEKTMAGVKAGTVTIAEAKNTLNDLLKVSNKSSDAQAFVSKQAGKLDQVENLNRAIALRDETVNNLKNGNLRTTKDDKTDADKAQADFEYYLKLTQDQTVATQLLREENERLNRTEFNVEASIYKTTEARKKSVELEELHRTGKSRLTDEQYAEAQASYEVQDGLEKQNQGRAAALQMLEKSVTAQEKYNQTIARANLLNQKGALSGEELTKVMAGAAEEFARQSQAISGITTAIGNAFSDAILNGKSFNDVLSGLARTIAEVIIKTQVVLPLVKALNQAAGNLFGPGSSGVLTVQNKDGGSTSVYQSSGNVVTTFPVLPNAKGNVYDGGNVLPFARGGVVTNPKFFPMATGQGLMGEAGPEAVMPLRRGPDGKLGVAAATSGGGTQVNVYNQNGGQVETKQRSSSDGGKVIDIYIKKAVAEGISSGQFDKAMGSTYGLRRQGAR
jgi:lambda family phage tail tape measure protein